MDIFYLFRRFWRPSGNFWYVAGRWQEEPIGVFVPVIALVIILFAPQMPDMFAGIANGFLSQIGFAFSAAFLGLSSWYWTRAALAASFKEDDASRAEKAKAKPPPQIAVGVSRDGVEKRGDAEAGIGTESLRTSTADNEDSERLLTAWAKKREEAREQAPRIAIGFASIIALAPVLGLAFQWLEVVLSSDRRWSDIDYHDIPYIGAFFGAFLCFLAWLFVRNRHRLPFCHATRRSERLFKWAEWPPLGRPIAIIAAAPLGPGVAFSLLVVSVAGIITVASRPEIVERILNTPTAALLALALVIPLLVLLLAFMRDVIYSIGWLVAISSRLLAKYNKVQDDVENDLAKGDEEEDRLLDKLAQSYKLRPKKWATLFVWSSRLGLATLVALFLGVFMGLQNDLYKVRTTGVELTPGGEANEPGPACQADRPAQLSATPATSAAKPVLTRPWIEQAVIKWHQQQRDLGYPDGWPMPVIIVAAEGGASRAAVWLLSAMRLLDQHTSNAFGRYVFAISGVSGGSLGAVTYLEAARKYGTGTGGLDWTKVEVDNGLKEMATADLLSASIATYLLNDTISGISASVGISLGLPDRAAALEGTFERHWQREWLADDAAAAKQASMGLIELQQSQPRLPHLFLVGTDVGTGRRVITSTIRFGPKDDLFAATEDLITILGHDVPAATAVTNSARFPFVSPTGRFRDKQSNKWRQVVDGGYFENYGVRTAADLSRKINEISDKCSLHLVPIVVVASNDGDGVRPDQCKKQDKAACPPLLETVSVSCDDHDLLPPETAEQRNKEGHGVVPEALAPLLGLYASRSGHGQDALHIVRRSQCPGRMIHLALPKADPERGEAAPLNWVLNEKVSNLLLVNAPSADFNIKQACKLKDTLCSFSEPQDPICTAACEARSLGPANVKSASADPRKAP